MPDQPFEKELKRIGDLIRDGLTKIPGAIKVVGIEFIHDNFAKQGFEKSPGAVDPWKKRKEVIVKGKKGKKKSRSGRNILINKGLLRRSWASDSSKSKDAVIFTSHLPYASVHNEGERAGRGVGFTMPERKMIGDSEALNQRVKDEVDRIVGENLNNV
jgi:phage gpG-like protein